MKKRGERVNKGWRRMGGRRRRERVNGERGWRERRLLLSRLSWRSSKVLLIIFKHSSCGSFVCASTFFYLNALSSFFNIALTFVALCMSSYLWCTFLQMAYNSCFLLSMCTLSIFKCLCPSSLLLLHFSVSLLYFVMQSLDPSGVLSVSWFQCCCFVFVLLCKILANLYFSS